MPGPAARPASDPLVTAVIIFLDAEPFLAEAIESVLAQTLTAWELVLVDDGSTDGSTRIARDYAARDPARIRYLDHPGHANLGMSASRNIGAAAGTAPFIAHLDADDIWLPDRLAAFVATAQAFPEAAMVYAPTLYWFSWAAGRPGAVPLPGNDYVGALGLPTRQLLPAPAALREFLLSRGGSLPCTCSLLIRRDAYDAVGGFDPEFRTLYEDQVFLSKIAARFPVVVLDEVHCYYRQHPGSCCAQAVQSGDYDPNDYHAPRADYLRWLRAHLAAIGLADPVIDAAIAEQLRPYEHPFLVPVKVAWRRTRRAIKRRLKAAVPVALRRALRHAQHTATGRWHAWRESGLAETRR